MDWPGASLILFPNQEKRVSQWEPHAKHRSPETFVGGIEIVVEGNRNS